jgi:hypothetical protein
VWKNARVVSAGLSVPTVCVCYVSVLSQTDRQTLDKTPVPFESTTIHWHSIECGLVIKSTTLQIIVFEIMRLGIK